MGIKAFQRLAKEGLVKGEHLFPTPTVTPRQVPRFLVRQETPVSISQVSPLYWRPYLTTKDLGFERFEKYEKDGGYYHFRLDGWLMQVQRRYVVHREDTYEPGT